MSKTRTKWIEDAAITKSKLNADVAGEGLIGGAGSALTLFDLTHKKSARVATTGSNINLSGGAPNVLDDITLAVGDRILVKDQTTASQNGIYYVSNLGTGSNGTWTRASDVDSNTEVISGIQVYISEGTINKKTLWALTTPNPITLDASGLTFEPVSPSWVVMRVNGGGSSPNTPTGLQSVSIGSNNTVSGDYSTIAGGQSGYINTKHSSMLGGYKSFVGSSSWTSCTLATTSNITLNGEQTIDEIITSNSRVLVKNQTNVHENGIYISSSGAWTRASDANTSSNFINGKSVFVTSGSTNGAKVFSFFTPSESFVIDTDPVLFYVHKIRFLDCSVATTSNITLSGEQIIDGVLTNNYRVLVKNQTNATENGIYTSSAGAWTRASDAASSSEFVNNRVVRVTSGDTNSLKLFRLNMDSLNSYFVLGTSNIYFSEVNASTSICGTYLNNQGTSSSSVIVGGLENSAINTEIFIGGGSFNTAIARASTIAGGHLNIAQGEYSFIGGGSSNMVTGTYSVIAGGLSNGSYTPGSTYTVLPLLTVGGGLGNCSASGGALSISGLATVCGGNLNLSSVGSYASTTSGLYNCVLGGRYNITTNSGSTGISSLTIGSSVIVGGGSFNLYITNVSTGNATMITGHFISILGGSRNLSIDRQAGTTSITLSVGDAIVICGGTSNFFTSITGTGIISGTYSYGSSNSIVGGSWNGSINISDSGNGAYSYGSFNFQGGGEKNCYLEISGATGYGLTLGTHNVIVGGFKNCSTSNGNLTIGNYNVIVGGYQNQNGNKILGDYNFIGGGYNNYISDAGAPDYACILGGRDNSVNADYAVVLGGSTNSSSGLYSSSIGFCSVANLYGQSSQASGCFSNAGDAQTSTLVMRVNTTTNDSTDLHLDGTEGNQDIYINENSTNVFYIDVVGGGTESGNHAAAYNFKLCVARFGSNNASIIGSVAKTVIAVTDTALDANVNVDTNYLKVSVIGIEYPINWVAFVRMTSVANA